MARELAAAILLRDRAMRDPVNGDLAMDDVGKNSRTSNVVRLTKTPRGR